MRNLILVALKVFLVLNVVIIISSCEKEEEPLNKLPSIPILNNPENGIIVESENVIFKWNSSTDIEGDEIYYYFYITEDTTQWNILNVDGDLEVEQQLSKGRKYYWKVAADNNYYPNTKNQNNIYQDRSISETRYFYTPVGEISSLKDSSGNEFIEISWEHLTHFDKVNITFEPAVSHITQPVSINSDIGKIRLDGMENTVVYTFYVTAADINGHLTETDTLKAMPLIPTQVHDAEFNIYNTIQIGSQVWLAENLRTKTWDDGTLINPDYYIENSSGEIYYKHQVARYEDIGMGMFLGNACPCGYQVSSDADWLELETYLGMQEIELSGWDRYRGQEQNIADLLKNEDGWNTYNGESGGGTNDFLFSALPVGYYLYNIDPNKLEGEGQTAYFWSYYKGPESGAVVNRGRMFSFDNKGIYRSLYQHGPSKTFAGSIRCLKKKN